MKSSLALVSCLLLVFLSSCINNKGKNQDFELSKVPNTSAFYGGVFRLNETEYYRSLMPINVTEVVGHRITNQIYEGLVMLDPKNLEIKPCLADSWIISPDALTYTFYLRHGVLFHKDPCFENERQREFNAYEVKSSFDRVCKPAPFNQGYWIFQGLVKGADECYNGSTSHVSGVTILDSFKIEVKLIKPFAPFLAKLSTPFCFIIPSKAFEVYGGELRYLAVGTGPFMLKRTIPDEAVFLQKNPEYWGKDNSGNRLPYLNAIKFSFIKDEKVEMLEFENGNLEMKYRLPLDMYDQILDKNLKLTSAYSKFQLQSAIEMSTQYYGFLHTDTVFNNALVRKAFCFAVDRVSLCKYTIKGQGVPAMYGLVPPVFVDYPFKQIKGYSFNPELARDLLKKAGYPNGKGFPAITLQINSGGGRNLQVAEAVKKMIEENLNIQVNISQLNWAQHSENIETSKSTFWRLGWIADYPDPENYLNLCYSIHVPDDPQAKAYINSFRYKSALYDSLFVNANKEIDDSLRNLLLMQCDQKIVDDAVMLNLYHDQQFRLLQSWVHNFPQNPMEYRTFRDVYLSPK